jgi:hypothetical protein
MHILVVLTVFLVAGCALLPKRATPTPFPVAPLAPTSTPPPVTVDVAAIITAAAGTAVAQFVAELTATAAVPPPSATPPPPPPSTATPEPVEPDQSPTPEATQPPTVLVQVSGMRYEPWGRPMRDCGSYDDKQPVRRFAVELTLVNTSQETINARYPRFQTAEGRPLETCFYPYDRNALFPPVPPGESRTVTLAIFCETHETVARMDMVVGQATSQVCFGAGGDTVRCP